MKKDITPEGSVVPVYLEPMSDEAIAEYNSERARIKAEADAKAEAKIAAQAKLAALGLTIDDLKALGL
jgi:hypothetical protein